MTYIMVNGDTPGGACGPTDKCLAPVQADGEPKTGSGAGRRMDRSPSR